MAGPILIVTTMADELAEWLGERLPDERFLPVTAPAMLDAALAENPEVAFFISEAEFAGGHYNRAVRHPSVRWAQTGGSGYEYIGEWDRAQVTVTNGLGILAPYLAETAIGALIALNNGLIRYREDQRARVWEPRPFRPVAGQTLAVVGAGTIGREVAARAQALGMTVIGVSRDGAPRDPFAEMLPMARLDEALGRADVVSCHLRLAPETRDLFDAGRFAAMKPGALFLNSARGGCVDEEALLAALSSGHLRGAWLDVFRTEPLPAGSPLWEAPNLLITPHASDQIEGWAFRFAAFFAENVGRWRRGEPLANRV